MGEFPAAIGTVLGGLYRLEQTIGSGGMGVVYLAQDLKHNRKVAVKVLRPEVANAVATERFLREIATVAKLAHPGILPIHDSGSTNGLLYFVMPYVDGGSLRTLIEREGALPLDRAVDFATLIGSALSYAHSCGIVHRDLKPGNILIHSGSPVVADFGLSLALSSDLPRISEAGVALGTPLYMSPEQASGSGRVDTRADVYALGCVVYEMLAEEPPITGPNVQTIIARKLAGDVPRLRVARPMIPRETERAILRALAPVPGDRFATIDAFIQALRARTSATRRATTLAAPLLVAAAILSGAYLRAGQVTIDRNVILVDQFENRTPDQSLAALGISTADWLTQGLHGTRLATVIPTPMALQASRFARRDSIAADRRDPLTTLARETGAGVIVSGSYEKFGARLVFHTQIYDAASSLWSPGHVRIALRTSLDPVSVSRDSIAEGIALLRTRVMSAIALSRGETKFSAPELDHAPPAYEAYLSFIDGMNGYIATDAPRAIEGFMQAYKRDTTFVVALLYAALTMSNVQRYATEDSLLQIVARSADRLTTYHRLWLQYRQTFLSEDRNAALRAVRALAAEAPRSKAVYNLAVEAFENGHLQEAVTALKTLTPEVGAVRDFLPYWALLASAWHLLGRDEEALKVSRQAQRAHPGMLLPVAWELEALAGMGDVKTIVPRTERMSSAPIDGMRWSPGEAIREIAEELDAHGHQAEADSAWRAALRWFSSNGTSGNLPLRDLMGWASTLSALGRYDDAVPVVAAALRAAPTDVRVLGLQGTVAAHRGDTTTARSLMRQLASSQARFQFGRPVYHAALIASVLGEKDMAMRLLQRARAEGRAYGSWMHREPDLKALRGDPAFAALVQPIPLASVR